VDECKPLPQGQVHTDVLLLPQQGPGEAVQLDPIKFKLKATGTKRLKLKCDEPLSSFALHFNLRRYNQVHMHTGANAGKFERFMNENILEGEPGFGSPLQFPDAEADAKDAKDKKLTGAAN